jgi:hypothetical protein
MKIFFINGFKAKQGSRKATDWDCLLSNQFVTTTTGESTIATKTTSCFYRFICVTSKGTSYNKYNISTKTCFYFVPKQKIGYA